MSFIKSGPGGPSSNTQLQNNSLKPSTDTLKQQYAKSKSVLELVFTSLHFETVDPGIDMAMRRAVSHVRSTFNT